MKFKICGLRRPKDIEYVNQVRPDFAGFVFVPGRRRTIDEKEAEKLTGMLAEKITPVGVFANQPIEFIANLVKRGIIEAVQLHGSENSDYINDLRAMLARRENETSSAVLIIKAFSMNGVNGMSDRNDMNSSDDSYDANNDPTKDPSRQTDGQRIADKIASCPADAILLDSGIGGTGESWDLRLADERLRSALRGRPLFLAGGLTAENAATAAELIRPYALDVSSGVETDGMKDPKKITAFAAAVRECKL